MAKTITFDITVPDDAGNDVNDIIQEAYNIFNNTISDTPDYDNDNIYTWRGMNPINPEECITSGISVDFRTCIDKVGTSLKLIKSMVNLMDSPEWRGMLDADTEACEYLDDDNNPNKDHEDDFNMIVMNIKVPVSCDMAELTKNMKNIIDTTGDNATVAYHIDFNSIYTEIDMSHECSAHLDCDAITDITNQIINVYRPTE